MKKRPWVWTKVLTEKPVTIPDATRTGGSYADSRGQPKGHKRSVQANKPLISTKCWTTGHEIITLRVSVHELESHKP